LLQARTLRLNHILDKSSKSWQTLQFPLNSSSVPPFCRAWCFIYVLWTTLSDQGKKQIFATFAQSNIDSHDLTLSTIFPDSGLVDSHHHSHNNSNRGHDTAIPSFRPGQNTKKTNAPSLHRNSPPTHIERQSCRLDRITNRPQCSSRIVRRLRKNPK
jgi:hypothetical protein